MKENWKSPGVSPPPGWWPPACGPGRTAYTGWPARTPADVVIPGVVETYLTWPGTMALSSTRTGTNPHYLQIPRIRDDDEKVFLPVDTPCPPPSRWWWTSTPTPCSWLPVVAQSSPSAHMLVLMLLRELALCDEMCGGDDDDDEKENFASSEAKDDVSC